MLRQKQQNDLPQLVEVVDDEVQAKKVALNDAEVAVQRDALAVHVGNVLAVHEEKVQAVPEEDVVRLPNFSFFTIFF